MDLKQKQKTTVNPLHNLPFNESVGDRMKKYENALCTTKVDFSKPFVVRIDGHNFRIFTRGLKKPYDYNLHQVFVNVCEMLIKEFNAHTVYTHSDEISLLYYPKKTKNKDEWREPPFGGRIQKLVSIIAGYTTSKFNCELRNVFSGKEKDYKEKTFKRIMKGKAYFDARVFNLPSEFEMYNYIFWRSAIDCKRNHVGELARKSGFSKKDLYKKGVPERIKMLAEKGIDWDKQPLAFQCGTLFKRVLVNKGNNMNVEVKMMHKILGKYDAEFAKWLALEFEQKERDTKEEKEEKKEAKKDDKSKQETEKAAEKKESEDQKLENK